MSMITLVGTGRAVMAVVMAALWMIQLRQSAAGFVGVAWSFGTALLGVCFAWSTGGLVGRPATEALALAARGDAYRDYQRTTRVFVPWPPRTKAR
jgi:steroid 5-alpha reductase family enzyme